MTGGSAEIGVLLDAVRKIGAIVGIHAHAEDADGAVGEGEGPQRRFVVSQLFAGKVVVENRDLDAVFFGQAVVGQVVTLHGVFGFGGGDEDVVGAGDLVGDRVGFVAEAGERLGEQALVFDGEVVQAVVQAGFHEGLQAGLKARRDCAGRAGRRHRLRAGRVRSPGY